MSSIGAFDYFRPRRLEEASAVLLETGVRAAVLAGGTDLLPRLKRRQRALDVVVDLRGVPGFDGIEERPDGLRVGALVTPRDLATSPLVRRLFPAVAEAARLVGAAQVREMATVGGALCSGLRCQLDDQPPVRRAAAGACVRSGAGCCHATRGGLCVATQACDLPPALAVSGALVEIGGPEGRRELTVARLHTGDGLGPLALAPGELVLGVLLPWPAEGSLSAYTKLRLRKAVDRPLLGLGLAVDLDRDGIVERLDVTACGVGPAVRHVPSLDPFVGSRLDGPLAEAVGRAVSRWLAPSPALVVDREWRRGMGRVLARRALERLALCAAASVSCRRAPAADRAREA